MNLRQTWEVPLITTLLADLRKTVEETLQNFSVDTRNAASMVAAELVSNAIKYGASVPAAPKASVTLTVTSSHLKIAVTNGVDSERALNELRGRILQIAQAEDQEQLYINRLQQMLDDPLQTGKLGLYRISFEGQFRLTCTYAEQILTVTATREIL